MEHLNKHISELLWRKDQAYDELAEDYFHLQLEHEELRENFQIIFKRLQQLNQEGTDEEYD